MTWASIFIVYNDYYCLYLRLVEPFIILYIRLQSNRVFYGSRGMLRTR